MNLIQRFHKVLATFALILLLSTTAACSSQVEARQPAISTARQGSEYVQLSRGDTAVGQDFGNWVVQTAKGLVQDAYVRNNNKLGVVITPQVRPNEVKTLAKSLAQGFHRNFPNQDISVLMYAPDKKLILTANYDVQSNQVTYK